MIVWCAFCQRYIEERAPWEDLQFSHGICAACAEDEEALGRDLGPARATARFLGDRAASLLAGRIPDPSATLEEARALGIRKVDLMIGLLQPLLCEVGRRFESGEIDVATEHRISRFAGKVLELFEEPSSLLARPEILLATVPGNAHGLGLGIFASILRERKQEVDVLLGAPRSEILRRLEEGDYRWLGLSIALPAQLEEARDLARAARSRSPETRLAAGGWVFKSPGISRELPEFDLVLDAGEVAALRPTSLSPLLET